MDRQKGFTLVEMAIVLVIIGIILAAVMTGRHLVLSAGQTQAQQAFLSAWGTILNDYYKAVRSPLADGPRHGGTVASPDGFMDGVGILASGPAFTDYRTAMGAGARDAIKQALNSAGLNPCILIKSNLQDDLGAPEYLCPGDLNPFEIMVNSEYVGRQRIMVGFSNYNLTGMPGFPTAALVRRNMIIFHNVPLDVAVRFDTVVDGLEGGNFGRVLNLTTTAAGLTPATYIFGTAAGSAIDMALRTWPRVTEASRSNVFTVGYVLDF